MSNLLPEDLTLDICVLITGSGRSDCNTNAMFGKDCLDLMKRMISEDRYRLAFDSRSQVETQYRSRLNPTTFGHYFVRQMATMDKVVKIPWQNLNRGVRVALETRGFTRHSEDYKFVVLASSTCCRKLVSHEPHFLNVQSILRRIDIVVLLPSNA